MTPEIVRDRLAMRRRFNRASASFEQASFLHREIRERLLERLRLLRAARSDFDPATILDLGAAQGELGRELQKTFSKALVVALDFAEVVLPAQGSWAHSSWLGRLISPSIAPLCADARLLPLRDASIDLIASNAMLHCCLQPEAVFAETLTEIRRVLRPGGAISFTLFGTDTLRELRTAWTHIDHKQVPVHPFVDMHNLGDFLVRAGFSDPVLDCETIKLTYSSFDTFMAELKAVGGTTWPPISQRLNVGLSGRTRLRALQSAYEGLCQPGALPVTVEVIYGLAWQPQAPAQGLRTEQRLGQRPGNRPGETLIPLDSFRPKR